ncbi:hypothetical protein [Phyllobacterium sophorae]|uniref:Phospholipase/carboxylesterase/thioesterase domain-containing protein n=1 Tax=Phyllobacterium sophorae TaxID=1520277 RepID=A0A2P7BFN9_9HYPH|nr:hypothetical protein [Phyllobacterium sophorae]PSH65270.1 hypothetical protein CU103_09700 [Phyllobacterium sophorae]
MIRLSANAHIAVTVSAVNFSGTSVLMLNEQNDPSEHKASAVADALKVNGASVELRKLPVGHGPMDEDISETDGWTGRKFR